ncbi:MAG: 5-(carboxyamino)imidazole ribonucleotide synthase [Alicyclobacillus herbarius]|uniref:5-(carboxyamino)imidazole ribonucleotide synthase n=1 Tax=Alicyclobacillus herbarius TaxID=122960 RepID=UPI0023542A94|nr:5-(carboxyamino)imidazole ribonucleotide synthase [Alicyclobacillus herbarius]MCL6633352.1 5-(carboxyamino)imidazole ribonucleotide synthase [Alicyclobacillus herbarius]
MSNNPQHPPVILPGSTVGILGGGQLGRMIAIAGRRMGYRFVSLDPTEDAPAGQVSDRQIVASYSDLMAARQLAELSDVITYEFENVDAGVAALLEREAFVPQGSQLLRITQHRVREKRAIEACGAQVAPYLPVRSREDLKQAGETLGYPYVLKTSTGGYDGKGQWLCRSQSELDHIWQEAEHAVRHHLQDEDEPLVAEKYISFTKELSVIVARSLRGQIQSFPVAENIHREHILHLSILPARIPETKAAEAQRLAEKVATGLQMVGLLAVEMFLTEDDQLYINELAPRPHNSGHYTDDACTVSQFEQHLRAICNLPLANARLTTPVVMVNVLGEHVAPLLKALPNVGPDIKIHLYGKHEAKPKRKMGHLNVLAPLPEAIRALRRLEVWPHESLEVGNSD